MDSRDVLDAGELGYWPTGNAFCIFFGTTPASQTDEIRAASAVNIIGKVKGDLSRFYALMTPFLPCPAFASITVSELQEKQAELSG